jgi:uncharacterized protein
MKPSRYNYYVPYKKDEAIIFFNGISKSIFSIPENEFKIFHDVVSYPDTFKEQYPYFWNTLLNLGFIVDDDKDEIAFVEQEFYKKINTPKCTLMIFPTYQCNFSCWYCVQHHTDEYMNSDVIEKIKKHIETYTIKNKIEELELSWFGGEPLLFFDECVFEISLFAMDFCKKNNIKFTNSITTNGYLITEEMLYKMKEINLNSFQITIDGCREQHNQVRNHSGLPSFDKILSNIVKILNVMPDSSMILRFNYTNDNIIASQIIEEVNSCVPLEYREKIKSLLRKVWQIEEDEINVEALEDIHTSFLEHNYKSFNPEIAKSYESCYAEEIHFNTIFPDGSVDKCGNISRENARGKLNSSGEIIWNAPLSYYEENIFTQKEKYPCSKCKYLPLCMGPCPSRRDKGFGKNVSTKCDFKNPKKAHEEVIRGYYEDVCANLE